MVLTSDQKIERSKLMRELLEASERLGAATANPDFTGANEAFASQQFAYAKLLEFWDKL